MYSMPASPSKPCSPRSTSWKAENFKVFKHHRNLPHPKKTLEYMQTHSISPYTHDQFYLKFSNSSLLHLFYSLFFTLQSPLTPSKLQDAPVLREYLEKIGPSPALRINRDPIGQFQSFAESYREWLNTNTAQLLRELDINKDLIKNVFDNGAGNQLASERVRVKVIDCEDYHIISYYVRKEKLTIWRAIGYIVRIILITFMTIYGALRDKFKQEMTRTKTWISERVFGKLKNRVNSAIHPFADYILGLLAAPVVVTYLGPLIVIGTIFNILMFFISPLIAFAKYCLRPIITTKESVINYVPQRFRPRWL